MYQTLFELDLCVLCSFINDLMIIILKEVVTPKFKNKFSKQSYRTSCLRGKHKEKYSNIAVDL